MWSVESKERAGQCGGWTSRSRQVQQQHNVPSRPKPARAPTLRSVVAVAGVLWYSVAPHCVSARQARSVVAVADLTRNTDARHSRCWMHCRSVVAVPGASWYCVSVSHVAYGVHTVFVAVWHDWARNVVGSHEAHASQTLLLAGKSHAKLTHSPIWHAVQPHSLPTHERHSRSLVRLGCTVSISFGSALHSYHFWHTRFDVGVTSALMNCPVASQVETVAHLRFVVGDGGTNSYCALSHEETVPHVRKVESVGGVTSYSVVASHVTLQT